jgi:Ni/Fe-hydrogenase 1 B-type cytochrome subunit
MSHDTIQAVRIWSSWLRLSHWIIGPGVLFLIVSARAIRVDYAGHDFWHDWHIMIGQLVFTALLLRLVLFFIDGSGHWKHLLNWRWRAMWQTLLCYLSFGRLPLPAWYAHNPLWKPLYLLLYILLALAIFSGLLYQQGVFAGMAVTTMHRAVTSGITLLAATHVIAVFFHDLKTRGNLVSAMINGVRYFHYRKHDAAGNHSANGIEQTTTIRVSVGSISKKDY